MPFHSFFFLFAGFWSSKTSIHAERCLTGTHSSADSTSCLQMWRRGTCIFPTEHPSREDGCWNPTCRTFLCPFFLPTQIPLFPPLGWISHLHHRNLFTGNLRQFFFFFFNKRRLLWVWEEMGLVWLNVLISTQCWVVYRRRLLLDVGKTCGYKIKREKKSFHSDFTLLLKNVIFFLKLCILYFKIKFRI